MPWFPAAQPAALRGFCRRDPGRYLFHLGDLDPREWGHSDYYWYESAAAPEALLLIYRGLAEPCVLAFGARGALGAAFAAALPLLPARGFFHGFDEDLRRLESVRAVTRRGLFRRMLWTGGPELHAVDTARAERLGPADLAALQALYRDSYPEAHFEPVQLDKGLLHGVREGERLLSVAGVHVLSSAEGVAMLGNIATRRERRGEGLARIATASLMADLSRRVRLIGLNVHADNEPARRLYEKLGFAEEFLYEEAAFAQLGDD